MSVRSKPTLLKRLARSGVIALALGGIVLQPVMAEAPASSEQRIEQLGQPQGGRGPAPRAAPQQAPAAPQRQQPQAQQPQFQQRQVQQRQPDFSQNERRGGGGGINGRGFGGYDEGRRFDEEPRYRRRPPVVYEEEPRYGGGSFGRACATSRGVCYVRRPQPFGSGCRCDIPGFGPKRGNIEG